MTPIGTGEATPAAGPTEDPGAGHRVSVVIPCRDAEATVGRSVRAALAQSVSPAEVIVVDDDSTDGSADAAARAGARVIRTGRRRNAGGARNLGLEVATGDVVAFLDADAEPAPDWIEGVVRVLGERPEVAGVGARIVDGRGGRYGALDWYLNHSEWIAGAAGERTTVPTMAAAFRRSAIEGLRFPESNSGEDTAFALAVRARGGTLWFDPGIAVVHRHERLDRSSFWSKQKACGRTIFRTRSSLPVKGRALVRWPVLLFAVPHLWIVLGRMARIGHLSAAARLFPWMVAGEVARIVGFFEERRRSRRGEVDERSATVGG